MRITAELSRVLKSMVDAGTCSFPEAEARLAAATLTVHIDAQCANEPAAQAAALTAVLTGVRCFHGGVWLSGAVETPSILPVRQATLGAAAVRLGARIGDGIGKRRIWLGRPKITARSSSSIGAWWDDWMAGVLPDHDQIPLGCGRNSLAGAAAGALAVAHAFRSEIGVDPLGLPARQTVSLWDPGSVIQGPNRFYLPDALWLIGLGNLGQAYLWALSLLPYRRPDDLLLVLQDEDTVRDVNWGTSVLVSRGHYGMLKTKLAEDWALKRGFRVRRLDRFADGRGTRRQSDPSVALSGLDSIAARRVLDGIGYGRMIDCGLGATARDYGRFRLNVFDPAYAASAHFDGLEDSPRAERNMRLPAYQDGLYEAPEVACGMAEMAGASVAVPFVSSIAATLAVIQAIRISSGAEQHRTVVGNVFEMGWLRTSGATVPSVRTGLAESLMYAP